MSLREPPKPCADLGATAAAVPAAIAPLISERHGLLLRQGLEAIRRADRWNGELPVFLLERCWLRLSAVPVQELAARLPPDCSREAPELVRYRELLAQGLPPHQAEQLCWLDFGMEACRQAQHRFWQQQERGNQGWTLSTYLDLLQHYRRRVEGGNDRPLPLLVLARQGDPAASACHQLVWLGPEQG
jgi:hypothetical protein